MSKVRALIVDDSEIARAVIAEVLQAEGDIEIVGEAADGYTAFSLVQSLEPDVVTMDVTMPGATGLHTLSWIMRSNPVPVIIVTGEPVGEGAQVAFEAMQLGAFDLVPKIALGTSPEAGHHLRELARAAAASKIEPQNRPTPLPSEPQQRVVADLMAQSRAPLAVIGVAAGKGGSRAVTSTLARVPRDLPCPVLLVQPIPTGYEAAYAKFLGAATGLRVEVVPSGGADCAAGTVFIAGEKAHLVLTRVGRLGLLVDTPLAGARPSADLLFRSMAEVYGEGALGLLLSGKGHDGVAGLRALHDVSAVTLAETPRPDAPSEAIEGALAAGVVERTVGTELLGDAIAALMRPPKLDTTRRPPSLV